MHDESFMAASPSPVARPRILHANTDRCHRHWSPRTGAVAMVRRCVPSLALVLFAAVPLAASTSAGRAHSSNALAASELLRAYEARYGAAYALHTPSFARQTGLACSACHTHYPELTAMGRQFKLNGYVLRRGSDSLQ